MHQSVPAGGADRGVCVDCDLPAGGRTAADWGDRGRTPFADGAKCILRAVRWHSSAEFRRDWFGSLPRFPDRSFGAAKDNLPAGIRKALNASVPGGGRPMSIRVPLPSCCPCLYPQRPSASSAVEKQFPLVSSRFPVCPPVLCPRFSAFLASWREMGSACDHVCATVGKLKHPVSGEFFIPAGTRSCAILWCCPRTEFRHDSCNTAPR
jgi:hypothetical protein